MHGQLAQSSELKQFGARISSGEFPDLAPLIPRFAKPCLRPDREVISNAYCLDSGRPGWTAIIFGGIHGNEHCGPLTIAALCDALKRRALELVSGRIVFALGHEQALQRNTRIGTVDLNRQFFKDKGPEGSAYEQRRVLDLKHVIDEAIRTATGKVLFIDNHSTSSPSRQYAILPKKSVETGRILGIPALVYGWANLLAAGGESGKSVSGATDDYVDELGGVDALTLESGRINDPITDEACYSTNLRALRRLGIVAAGENEAPAPSPEVFELFLNASKQCPDFRFTRQFHNLEAVYPGEVIARDSERTYQVPQSEREVVIVLPKFEPERAPLGSDLFKLAWRVS